MDKPPTTSADVTLWLRREALDFGYTDKIIDRMVRSGEWHRVRHGAYTSGEAWSALTATERHRLTLRAVLRNARSEAVASHVSAALEYGAPVWDIDLRSVHITRRDGKAGRKEAGVVQHRGLLTDAEVVVRSGLALTGPVRTAVDVTRLTDVEHSLVVVNGLLHAGLMTEDEFRVGCWQARRFPGALTAQLVSRLCDARIESAGESRTCHLCWSQRLPMPEPQFPVYDVDGRLLARLDFAWPELGVFLEFDGKEKYLKHRREGESVVDAVLREKRREERICELTGWRCIRVTWADLAHPELLARRIRRVLEAVAAGRSAT